MTTWILVANAAEAKLFVSENLRVGKLELLSELAHPKSRKKASELMADKPGHCKTDSGIYNAYSKNDPKEVEAEHFAIELAHELRDGWSHNKFKQLVVVVPAHFYGLINKHLDSHISNISHISKDYTKYNLEKLAASLKEHLFI